MKKFCLLLLTLLCICSFSEATTFVLHKTTDVEVKSGEHTNSKIFIESDSNYHYYKCSDEECTKVFRTSGHTFEEKYHTRSCTCEKCERYFPNQKELKGQHWRYCIEPNCFEMKLEYHSGGTHDNKGVCKLCNVTYQTHAENNGDIGYNDEYHWTSCSFAGCTHKTYSEHTRGLIQINEYRHYYVCTLCQVEFESEPHVSSTDFKSDASYHWQYCKTCLIPLNKTLHEADRNNQCSICKNEVEPYDDKQIESFELNRNYYSTSKIGTTFKLEIRNKMPVDCVTETFVWKSSKSEVASVDQSGNVTVSGLGITIISATAPNGVNAECVVYVGDNISLNKLIGPDEITVGDSVALTPVFSNGGIAIDESLYAVDYSALIWEASSSEIRVVDGYITALAPSKNAVRITVSLEGKGSKSITVKVVCRDNEHSFSGWTTNSTKHWQVCLTCGKTVNEGNHNGGTHDNGGYCKDCQYQYEKHNPTGSWKKYDEEKHYKKCYVSSCKEQFFESHKDKNDDSRCDDCGYSPEGVADPECTHKGGTHENNGYCTNCGGKYQDHTVGFWKQDGAEHYRVCVICGEVDRAKHKINTVTHLCECGYSQADNCEHTYGYRSLNSSNHEKYCTKNCGFKTTEPHKDEGNGTCVCGKDMAKKEQCRHPGMYTKLSANETSHWYECPECGLTARLAKHTLDESGEYCTICKFNIKDGAYQANYDIRINIYQTQYYIDRILNETTGEYEYKPIIVDMDIVGKPKEMSIISQTLEKGHDYLKGDGEWFYIKKLNDKQLEVGLTEKGKKATKYFDDTVVVKIKNQMQSEAIIKIIKAGEDRVRFYANVSSFRNMYNTGDSGEIVLCVKSEYIFPNSSEEELAEFEKLNKDKMGKFVINPEDVSVTVNNIAKDEFGNITNAVSSADVTSVTLKKDTNGKEYYEVKVNFQTLDAGVAKVITTVNGRYYDKNNQHVSEFDQQREAVETVTVYSPVASVGSSGGGSGSSSSNGGNSSGSNSELNGSSSSGSGGSAGPIVAGMGALALLVTLFVGANLLKR